MNHGGVDFSGGNGMNRMSGKVFSMTLKEIKVLVFMVSHLLTS